MSKRYYKGVWRTTKVKAGRHGKEEVRRRGACDGLHAPLHDAAFSSGYKPVHASRNPHILVQ
jgi:hypothetical protein